jgi:hypothetical protein
MKTWMLATAVAALVAPQQQQQRADKGKEEVEIPVKKRLADVGKKMVERPMLDRLQPPPEAKPAPKVAWHASFEKAVEAARTSGKPVLLFQLLGRLDEEFC